MNTQKQPNPLLPAGFQGDVLLLIKHKGEAYMAIKRIYDALELDWASHVDELKNERFQGIDITMDHIEYRGEDCVMARRICDAIGLDWKTQSAKHSDERVAGGRIPATADAGKQREMLFLPVRKFPGWLMTLNPAKVRLENRVKLVDFQTESAMPSWPACQSRFSIPTINPLENTMNTQTQTNSLLPVDFQGDTLLMIEHEGKPYVVARRICEVLGLDWKAQTVKLRDERFMCELISRNCVTPWGVNSVKCSVCRCTNCLVGWHGHQRLPRSSLPSAPDCWFTKMKAMPPSCTPGMRGMPITRIPTTFFYPYNKPPLENTMNTQTQTNPLLPVDFQGDTLLMIEHEGEPYVVARRICEAIGLNWKAQTVNLTDERFDCELIKTVGLDGKQREMLCLPLHKLFGWLASISAAKVKPAIRPKLLAYQIECDGVLKSYWVEGHAQNPRAKGGGLARHAVIIGKVITYTAEESPRGDYAREVMAQCGIKVAPRTPTVTPVVKLAYRFICDWQKHGLKNYSGKQDEIYLRWPEVREKAFAKKLSLPKAPPKELLLCEGVVELRKTAYSASAGKILRVLVLRNEVLN